MIAEVLTPISCVLGEGPLALGGDNFAFVDIRTGSIYRGSLGGNVDLVCRYSGPVSALAECADGRLVVAHGTSVSEVEGERSVPIETQSPVVPGWVERTNDGKVDPAGRMVVGTMTEPTNNRNGALWVVENGATRCLVPDVALSNGLCWSEDGGTLYFVDTPTQRIDAFDYLIADGAVTGRRPAVAIEPSLGAPDGICLDEDGGLWVALWGGGAVHRYLGGRRDYVVHVPTPFVTSLAFVGRGLSTMLITTASELNSGEPGAGHLYTAEVGVRGLAPYVTSITNLFGAT